ncbi:MAG: TetR/AcrR family transcriptional regulator [Actinomycetia bacterium]|nr:TetR/AcrR family transcriptional regulator [Actinomycetes bacterium]MCH9768414.1 TetR/AcrR family transcriptional regulator [Actinomycetes bacterium]
MTASSATRRPHQPIGREEVAAAILTAAAELFAERGPAATSIRDIAARSKVNHGLVFRHFGTKEKLVGAVLDDLSMNMSTLLSSGAPADAVERAIDLQMQVVARALLDGYPAGQLQQHFPNVATLFDRVRPLHGSESNARMAVANALAVQFGWRLFESFLRSAAGIDDMTDGQLRQAVSAEVARILEPH